MSSANPVTRDSDDRPIDDSVNQPHQHSEVKDDNSRNGEHPMAQPNPETSAFLWDLYWVGIPGALGGVLAWNGIDGGDWADLVRAVSVGGVVALALFLSVSNINRKNLTAVTVFAFFAGYAPESTVIRFLNHNESLLNAREDAVENLVDATDILGEADTPTTTEQKEVLREEGGRVANQLIETARTAPTAREAEVAADLLADVVTRTDLNRQEIGDSLDVDARDSFFRRLDRQRAARLGSLMPPLDPTGVARVDALTHSVSIGAPATVPRTEAPHVLLRVEVNDDGDYVLDIDSAEDLVAAIYDVTVLTEPIAADDDSGNNHNPRINHTLTVGKYYLRVAPYSRSRSIVPEFQVTLSQ